MKIGIQNINLGYGSYRVFSDFSIDFEENEINCILGPSGCGKTSLLNILSGLTVPDSSGENHFQGKKISYVFQDPRLLPWMTVRENIAFVLKDILTPPELHKRVNDYLQMVKLEKFSDLYPKQLSGGMRQRVSLARAFSYPSEIILMDEPFKGLDIKLKKEMSDAFGVLWNHRKVTVIWVSHDIEEALIPGRNGYIFSQSPVKILRNFKTTAKNQEELRKEIKEILENQAT